MAALATASPGNALADTTLTPAAEAHMQDISAFVEQGGIEYNRAPVACSGLCTQLVDGANAETKGRSIWGQLANLGQRVGLIPGEKGPTPPKLGVAGLALTFGYTVYNAYHKIRLDHQITGQALDTTEVSGVRVTYPNELIAAHGTSSGNHYIRAPSWGVRGTDDLGNTLNFSSITKGCAAWGGAPLPNWTAFGTLTTDFDCPWDPGVWGQYLYVAWHSVALEPPETVPPGGSDPPNYPPVQWAGDPSTSNPTAVQTAIQTELDTHPGDYQLLIQFINALDDWNTHDGEDETVKPDPKMQPELSQWEAPDPDNWQRWCELSLPGTNYMSVNSVPGAFDVYPNAGPYPSSTLGSVDMLYGDDDEDQAKYGPWSKIKGFGIRKIAAKHGWSAADDAATAATLLAPTSVTGPSNSDDERYVFRGSMYTPTNPSVPLPYANQALCQRVVVVATQARQGEPRSRSIITSYGKWTGSKP